MTTCTWLVIGSGPSAKDALHAATLAHPVAIAMAANGGILACPVPDYLFLADRVACARYRHHARRARRCGTQLVTLRRDPRALRDRGLGDADELIDVPGHDAPANGRYGRFVRSGVTAVEYACHRGAERVVLIGWDGYRAGYLDGHRMPDDWAEREDALIERLLAEVRAAWPDVPIERIDWVRP